MLKTRKMSIHVYLAPMPPNNHEILKSHFIENKEKFDLKMKEKLKFEKILVEPH